MTAVEISFLKLYSSDSAMIARFVSEHLKLQGVPKKTGLLEIVITFTKINQTCCNFVKLQFNQFMMYPQSFNSTGGSTAEW